MKLNAELSPCETEIAELLAWGASKKETADRLFISPRTVENTARNIYAKIGIQKATELCVWWFCNKCGVPVGLDPLKRAFIATVLLLAFLPYELRPDTDNFTQRTTARTTRTIRAQKRQRRRIINPLQHHSMSKQDIITAIFGKTESGEPYTLKQGLVFVWFAFSLSALCLLAEGPYWLLAILFANFWASQEH